jgi:N-acetyl-anhydromuramyl-L-alanine amidase AmpD
MANPKGYFFKLPEGTRPAPFRLTEERIPDFEWYNQHRATTRIYHPINGIEAVVIHATAGYATQHALDAWRSRDASAHWIVPDEDEPQHGQFVWSVVSESLAAHHVRNSVSNPDLRNRKKINHWSLGVEIVNTQEVQHYADLFSEWQVKATALIVRYCWTKYPNLRYIVSHAKLDPSRRGDPGKNFPWTDFRGLVLSNSNDPPPNPLRNNIPPVAAFPAVPLGGCCP